MKNFLKWIVPPRRWRITVIMLCGIFTGILFLVVYVSNAFSYLSDKPEACINCHVMFPHYASWSKSGHASVTCADCHVPHGNFFRKYYVKGMDGLAHSTYFTFRWEPQVIQMKERGIGVVQENCIRCHYELVDMVQLVEVTGRSAAQDDGKLCWECHRETPHGSVKSLSAAPHSVVERLPSVLPDWLRQTTETRP